MNIELEALAKIYTFSVDLTI